MNTKDVKKLIELKANARKAIMDAPSGRFDGRRELGIFRTLRNGAEALGFTRDDANKLTNAVLAEAFATRGAYTVKAKTYLP